MAKNYTYKYEISSSDSNFPARVILFDKPGKACYIDKHWHKSLEINYVLEGDLIVDINGKSSVLQSKDFTVISEGDVHKTDGKFPDEHVKYIVIIYSYGFTKNYFPNFEYYRYIPKTKGQKAEIKRYLKKIEKYIDSKNELSEMHILAALVNILETLFSSCKEPKDMTEKIKSHNGKSDYAKIGIEYIKEHFKEQLSLEQVASVVGLSPTYFAKYFKTKTNKTFYNYLSDIRLANTIADLQNYDVSETEAAFNNGFPNVKSFIKNFKRKYNCTLSEYVKEHNNLPTIYEYNKYYDKNNYD